MKPRGKNRECACLANLSWELFDKLKISLSQSNRILHLAAGFVCMMKNRHSSVTVVLPVSLDIVVVDRVVVLIVGMEVIVVNMVFKTKSR